MKEGFWFKVYRDGENVDLEYRYTTRDRLIEVARELVNAQRRIECKSDYTVEVYNTDLVLAYVYDCRVVILK